MRDNVESNLQKWDVEHRWAEDGDEWKGQAQLCGVPYLEWKLSLVDHLIRPHVSAESYIVEIAPGHGRWTEFLLAQGRYVTAVDLSPSCLVFCRERFAGVDRLDLFLTDGTRLPRACTEAVDFVWSYDSFVHMAPEVVATYLSEIRRVLTAGGTAVIHHADVDLATHKQEGHKGWRSEVSAELVRELAAEAGLTTVRQLTYWDEIRRIGCPRFNDKISVLRRPE